MLYGDKSNCQLIHKEKFLVLHLSTYSTTSIVFYELTEASYLQLQPPHHLMHHLLYSGCLNFISPLVFSAWCNARYSKPLGVFQNVKYFLHNFWFVFLWMSNNSIILFCLLNCLHANLEYSLYLYVSYLKTEKKEVSEMSKLTFSIYTHVPTSFQDLSCVCIHVVNI
jgi:hypothetical protein